MSFINWGSESPEQLAIRRRLEEQALYEQAVRMAQAKQRAGQAPGVAGGSGDPLAGLYGIGYTYGDMTEGRIYSLGRGQAEWQLNYLPFPEIAQATLNQSNGFLYAVVEVSGTTYFGQIDRSTREVTFIPNNIDDFTVDGASSLYWEGGNSFIYLDNANKKSNSSIIRIELGGSPEYATATQLAEVDAGVAGYGLRNLFLYEGSPWAIAYSGPDIITGPIDLETGNFIYSNLVLPSPSQPNVQGLYGVFSTVEYKGKVWVSAVWDGGGDPMLGLFEMDTETGGALAPYYLKYVKDIDSWSGNGAQILSLTYF